MRLFRSDREWLIRTFGTKERKDLDMSYKAHAAIEQLRIVSKNASRLAICFHIQNITETPISSRLDALARVSISVLESLLNNHTQAPDISFFILWTEIGFEEI